MCRVFAGGKGPGPTTDEREVSKNTKRLKKTRLWKRQQAFPDGMPSKTTPIHSLLRCKGRVSPAVLLGGLGAIVPLAAHGGGSPWLHWRLSPRPEMRQNGGGVWRYGVAFQPSARLRCVWRGCARRRCSHVCDCAACRDAGAAPKRVDAMWGGWRRGTGPWRTERAVKRGINRLLRRDVAVLRYYGGDSQEVFGGLRCGLKVAGFRSISRCGWRCAGGWCGRRSQSRRARSCRCRALPPLHP